jgi:protein involved in ribonucleotide reduction
MPLESPVSILFNTEGQELAVSQSQSVSSSMQPGLLLAGSSSLGAATFFRVTPEGELFVTGSFNANVVFPLTQSVEIVASNTTSSVAISEWQSFVTASVREVGASTTALSSAVASTTAIEILASNPNRSMATLYVDGNRPWFIAFGATASPSSFTVRVPVNSYFELPARYTGTVSAVSNGNGGSTLHITDIILP